MDYAPTDYDFGTPANYSFAMEITCANDEARAMFVEAFGHMLNYNHEQAIACFSKVTELDETCAMAWWGTHTVCLQITTGHLDLALVTIRFKKQ